MRRTTNPVTTVACDRCGGDMTEMSQQRMELRVWSVVLAMQGTIDAGPGPYNGQTLDLCNTCMRTFVEWMSGGDRTKVRVVFDGPPGPEPGRFVEAEDVETGASIGLGDWVERENGWWDLVFQVATEDIRR